MSDSSAAPTLLITGCSSGIGLCAARMMTDWGWRVVASCRKDADVERLRADGLMSVRIDYEDADSISNGFNEALELLGGRLDGLFNNGAYAIPGLLEDMPTDALRTIFETNVFGWHTLTRLAITQFRSQELGANGARGRIVQNSSVLGFTGVGFRGSYCATKYAIEGLSDVMRVELRSSKIDMILIEPGPVASRIRENSIPHFNHWVDWENSPRRSAYERKLLPRLNKAGDDQAKDRWELGPDAVARKLRHALESKRPRPRYYVTTPTYIAGYMKRVLSTRAFDRLIAGS